MWGIISWALIAYFFIGDQPVEFKLGILFVAALFAIANGLANISYRLGKLNEKKESKNEN